MFVKRWLMYIVAVVLIAGLLLSACAAPAPAPPPAPSPAPAPASAPPPKPAHPPWPETVSMAGNVVGSAIMAMCIGYANILNKHVPEVKITVEPTSGPNESTKLVGTKKTELAWSVDALTNWGYRGQRMFGKGGPLDFRILTSVGLAAKFNIFTLADSGIESIPDLRGKRVAGKFPGQPVVDTVRQAIFEYYQMTDDDVKLVIADVSHDAVRLVKEGVADAGMFFGSVPTPALMDLASVKAVRFIPLDADAMEAVHKTASFYFPSEIKAGSYPGLDKDVLCIGSGHELLVMTENDELVYAWLTAHYDHEDELIVIHPTLRFWTIKDSLRAWNAPYHPGSIKFFKDRGLWTAEMDVKQQKLLKEGAGAGK